MTDEPYTIGDGPIDPDLVTYMTSLARGIDRIFNGELQHEARKTGFVLMAFPFGDRAGRCNYISNADRADVIVLLREQLAHFEGRALPEGHGQ